MAFLNYDYQNQNQNWSGTSPASAANNDDKDIETHFLTFGLQYMFSPQLGRTTRGAVRLSLLQNSG